MNCNFCNNEITDRHHLAKICWNCARNEATKIGNIPAISAVAKAVKDGILAPVKTLKCVDCGSPAQCYDHRDYAKPLDVEPVCRKCNFRRGSALPLSKSPSKEERILN